MPVISARPANFLKEQALPKAHQSNARIAFIDFEASGLGARSWPVEVGWAFENGAAESFLIKPASAWPLEAWDDGAEKLHGLSKDVLDADGHDPAAVCKAMLSALDGCVVYSDAPDWDGFWMLRLFEAARRKPEISLQDFASLMPFIDADKKLQLIRRADELSPRRHRAADDARYLQVLYRQVQSSK